MFIRALCLLFLLAGLSVSAQTNQGPFCCRFPLRILGPSAGVDLNPLFQWWTGHGGQNQDPPAATTPEAPDPSRPLTAWKRIRGFPTSVQNDAWVVYAEVSTSPTSRTNEYILLKHPPAEEQQLYYNLQAMLAQYGADITNDAQVSKADARAEKRAAAQANRDMGIGAKASRFNASDYNQQATQDRNAAAAAQNDAKQDEQTRAAARKRLETLPSLKGRYRIDLFALDLGPNSKGVPIFDVGLVYTGPR